MTSLRIGSRQIPIDLPNRRDARLHTAVVIITVHVIGITALGFRVSVPQILVAIGTAGVIDLLVNLVRTGRLVWPASGMLTGSGVALILRVVGNRADDLWAWDGWYWFALVAGLSVLTKFLIQWRGTHIFNPSNLGLVLAFLVLGREVVEPLDFWWAPLDGWMALAYAVIVVGGVTITRRLGLLEMAGVFWLVLVAGIGVLAASGHCMTTTWATTPVCGARFWTVLATSPEILVFLFFMITDPKTIPKGRGARVVFAATLGLFTAAMIAPHTLEFGAKVALLSSLVVWSPLRGVFDRLVSSDTTEGSGLAVVLDRIRPPLAPTGAFWRGVAVGSATILVGIGIVAAGVPARQTAMAQPGVSTETLDSLIDVEVDTADIPSVVVDDSVAQLDLSLGSEFASELAITLVENLTIESRALLHGDGSDLWLADGGERLTEMQAALDTALTSGRRPFDTYSFEALTLRRAGEEDGQTSAALAFEASGTMTRVTYDPDEVVLSRESRRFEATFVLRQLTRERWLIVSVGD